MAQISKFDVANQAITKVGGEPLETFQDDVPLSDFCDTNYDQAKAWALGLYRWTFATRFKQLSQLTNPPVAPLPYVYSPPQDVVGQVFAYRKTASVDCGTEEARPFTDGTKPYITSRSATLWAEYTAMVDESLWPAWFVQFFVTAFAVGCARAKQNNSLAAELWQEAMGSRWNSDKVPGGLLESAMEADGINAPQRELVNPWDPGPLVQARWWPGAGGLILVTAAEATFIDFTGTP